MDGYVEDGAWVGVYADCDEEEHDDYTLFLTTPDVFGQRLRVRPGSTDNQLFCVLTPFMGSDIDC